MDLSLIQNKIDSDHLQSCIFGSQGTFEKDIAIFGKNSKIETQLSEIKLVLKDIRSSYEIITKREQLAFTNHKKTVLHFLYYPTSAHFLSWELPSFGHYLNYHSTFKNAKPKFLEELSQKYLSNSKVCTEIRNLQLLSYCEIALHSYIFSITKPKWWKKEIACKTVEYLTKYITIELMMDKLSLKKAPFNSYKEYIHLLGFPNKISISSLDKESIFKHFILLTT